MRCLALLLGLLLWAAPSGLAAQDDPVASVETGTGEFVVRLSPLLGDAGLRTALHSGLPLRLEVRSELWRDGFFDSQEGAEVWRASIVHDPVRRSYEVEVAGLPPRRVTTLEEAGHLLDDGFDLDLVPSRDARYYWLGAVEVQTLSLSDLEELRRWLRGDVAPAVSGDREGGSAVANGVRRMVVRVLGLPTVRRRLRTDAFDFRPGADGGS